MVKNLEYTIEMILIHQWVKCIKKGPNGNIWIGTQNGISIFDGAKFKNINYLHGLPNNNVNEIYLMIIGDVLYRYPKWCINLI